MWFSGQEQVAKILNDKKYIQYSGFRATVLQGKRKLLKNPEWWKIFQYSVLSVYLQEVSGPIRIKLKKLVSGQIIYFQGKFFPPPQYNAFPYAYGSTVGQACRQDVAAGGAKNQEWPKTRRGGHIFKIQYWMYVATGGPNVKWGAPISNGGGGTTGPPLSTALQ